MKVSSVLVFFLHVSVVAVAHLATQINQREWVLLPPASLPPSLVLQSQRSSPNARHVSLSLSLSFVSFSLSLFLPLSLSIPLLHSLLPRQSEHPSLPISLHPSHFRKGVKTRGTDGSSLLR